MIKLDHEVGFLIAKIQKVAGRLLAMKLKNYNIEEINPAQGRILFALWHNDNISIRQLSRDTSLGKSTLTSMLDRLEETGYLERIPSKDDRRKIIIKLTGKDEYLQDIFVKVSNELSAIFYKDFTSEGIEHFEGDLKRAFDNISRYEAALRPSNKT